MNNTLLMVVPVYPYPPVTGALIDIWGYLDFFYQLGWKVVLCVCWTAETAQSQEQFSRELPINIDIRFVLRASRWARQETPQTIEEIQQIIDTCDPQIVWFEYAEFSNLASTLDIKDAEIWFRSVNFEVAHRLDKIREDIPWKTWGGRYGYRRAKQWLKPKLKLIKQAYHAERQMHKIAGRLFYISYTERRLMPLIYHGKSKKYWTLPLLKREPIPMKPNKTVLDVVYMGGRYDVFLNRVGAKTLLSSIIPAVGSAFPNTYRFHIVGRFGQKYFGDWATEHILIHDYVDDLNEFMKEIDIVCNPIKSGWGCKLKMLEALAFGLPVVGASQTFRSIPKVKGAYFACHRMRDYVYAFGELQSAIVRQQVGQQGYNAYQQWYVSAQQTVIDILKEVTSDES